MEGPRPYDFDPVFTAEEFQAREIIAEEHRPDEAIPNVRPSRLGNIDWCMCGNCGVMSLEVECVCCHEVDNFERLVASQEGCVTVATDFEYVCLNEAVLRATLVMRNDIRGHARNIPFQLDMKSYRYAAYRMLTYWAHGRLGRGVRKVCSVLCSVEDPSEISRGVWDLHWISCYQ